VTAHEKVTLPSLQQMKRDGQRSVCIVAWDYHMARIADRAGVEIISVGDTVGTNLWGHPNPLEVTMDQMVTVCQAVRRGVDRALLSCDFPYGPLQEGPASAVRAAIRLVKEAGIDLVKLDGAADYPDAVAAVVRAGIPVFAQFGITPQTAMHYGMEYGAMSSTSAEVPAEMTDRLVGEAKRLEEAGASLLNFTNSGPIVGPEVTRAVDIPVLGGFGGGPWLDGRIRMAHSAIGYPSSMLDDPVDTYANVAQISFDAITAYAEDVRAGRQIKSGRPTA
jgi:3-methyl-2-oxobutanoate hydroxymethyltransferase